MVPDDNCEEKEEMEEKVIMANSPALQPSSAATTAAVAAGGAAAGMAGLTLATGGQGSSGESQEGEGGSSSSSSARPGSDQPLDTTDAQAAANLQLTEDGGLGADMVFLEDANKAFCDLEATAVPSE
jgi:hypothetical protein